MAKHGVVLARAHVHGQFDPVDAIYSVKYEQDIDNGCVLELVKPIDTECWSAKVPTGKNANIVIITSGERDFDERTNDDLANFYNKAGTPIRGEKLKFGEVYELSAECFDGIPAKDKFVNVQSGKTKLVIAEEQTEATVGVIDFVGNGYHVRVL